jgi:HK97 family phage portal protein
MKWPFARLFETRSRTWRLASLPSWAEMGIGSGPSAAGFIVTPETALTVPAVAACITVLSQDTAKTPTKLRRKVGPDTFTDADDHPLWELLHDLPNPETTAFEFKRQMMADLLTHEKAYAEIVRVEGRVVALWRLDPTLVFVDRDEQRRKRYRVTLADGTTQTWTFDPSKPPILELTHPSPIRQCRDLIGSALALQTYVGKYFANGARLGGVLQTDGMINEEQAKQLKDSFSAYYSGSENAFKIAVLEQGLKYQPIAAPNSDAQLNETLQTVRTEIAATFRLPPWKVGDLSKATYSNVEAGAIEYATGCLDPWFTLWEHAIRRDLLTTRQFGAFDVMFDRSTLIRSDVQALHQALSRGRDAGYLSVNDVRRQLGMNPIPAEQGGDLYQANGNLRSLTDLGQPEGNGNGD